MEHGDNIKILEAIGLLAEQTRELKEDRGEILEAIGLLADQMQEMRFEIGDVKSSVDRLDTRVTRIEATMVTKDYLDDKLANLHSDIVKFVKRRVPSWVEP
jgi:uncharacterized coiled-coil DUF342 family protein